MNPGYGFAAASLWVVLTGLAGAAPNAKVVMDLPDVIGVTHSGGWYNFTGNGSDYVVLTRISPDSESVSTRVIAVQYKPVPLKTGAK